jgi:hypothetical protein
MSENSPSGFAGILSGFGPVQRVLLFLGFAVFCMGVPGGFSAHNRAMMIGVSLLAAGIAGHYWSTGRYDTIWDGDQAHGGGWKAGAVSLAIAFSIICVGCGWLAYSSK